jgi:hypothetical protein
MRLIVFLNGHLKPTFLIKGAVDRHRFDANPDPTFHFDAGPDQDPHSKQCQFSLFNPSQQCHRFITSVIGTAY